ncbi:hypothetical protein [Hymenobacter terrenus]|uniref:hypothetical protein n=1 Tax=Hymenobacter terrenus TaxID=1629124 RepID=UPI0006199319|nr:hypothetical protein [Hymenobacter terrenus]
MVINRNNKAHQINGYLDGVAVFSSMFLRNGAVTFETELLEPGSFQKSAARESTETEFKVVMLQWLRFGLIERYANELSALGPAVVAGNNSYERALLMATDDVITEALNHIREFFFGEEFKIYYPLKKIKSIEVLQDEFVFMSTEAQLYIRGGWSD